MKNKEVIALIPARSGSKGVVNKNIKLLNDQPLIAYTIKAACQAKNVSRVVVSTDSKEIATIAREFGAEVPFLRPPHLATDTANGIDVYLNGIEQVEKMEKIELNQILVLQPTSPLRKVEHIDEAIDLFWTKSADSVVSYCKEAHPIFWHKFLTKEGKFEKIFDQEYLQNRQELRPSYYPNGAIFLIKKAILMKNNRYGENSYAYIMDRKYSIDIDTEEDFKLAEFYMKELG